MIIQLLAPLLASSVFTQSIPYNWTWWGGETYRTGAVYPPSRGVYLASNKVGSRHYSGMFVDDLKNAAYVFGGYTYSDYELGYDRTNDLWKCDFSRDASSAWTWIHGSNQVEAVGVYTSIGDTNSSIYPGSRGEFIYFYDSDLRKFFIIGGIGKTIYPYFGYLNDLWSYDVDTNMFTWIGGTTELDEMPVFVPMEESDTTNIGGLQVAAFAYSHNDKLLYIFGGDGSGYTSNTLWRYRVSNNRFTALWSSSTNEFSIIESYGALSSGNKPGLRRTASMIVTHDNLLFVTGGCGPLPIRGSMDTTWACTSETWMYNITAGMWAFVGGSPYAYDPGNYTVDSRYAYPAAKISPNWLYDAGRNQILLQGGDYTDANIDFYECSDEWLFDVQTFTWDLVINDTCSKIAPKYGTYRVQSSQNRPGWRGGSAFFSSMNASYIFGGQDNGDLWKLQFAAPELVVGSTSSTTTTSQTTSTTEITSEFSSTSTASEVPPVSTPTTKLEETSTTTASEKAISTEILTTAAETRIGEYQTSAIRDESQITSSVASALTTFHPSSTYSNKTSVSDVDDNRSSRRALISRSVNPSVSPDNSVTLENLLDLSTLIYIIIGGAGFALLLILLAAYFFYKRYWQRRDYAQFKSAIYLPSVPPVYKVTPARPDSYSTETATLVSFSQEVLSVPAYMEVPDTSFRVTSKLSQGGGGEVYLADALDEKTSIFGNVIVVKRLISNSSNQNLNARQAKLFEQELSIMAMLKNHKNIAKIIGYCRSEPLSILMKHYRLGPLDKFIKNEKRITKRIMLHFISDIASGISALHQHDLSHSDIKSANVLIDTDKDGFAFCVLTDFGITQVLSMSLVVNGFNVSNIRGLSFAYASPETFKRQRAKTVFSDSADTFKAGDVYSWASLLYEMISRRTPWSKFK
ncbi:hypothetical protein MP638_003520 [Amoeboaphelidium occidentale]|nr:hypothetical protein MP638_003520 [Amoeboaphelidium occidentale]